jgi:hypothetical protein
MQTHSRITYQLKLTPRQQEELRELTGKTGEVLELSVQELEDRILPGFSGTN